MQNKTKQLFKVLVFLIFTYCFSNSSSAQEIEYPDKRFIFEDFFSLFPGEGCLKKNNSISFFYSIPFGLKELSTRSLNIDLNAGNFICIETFISDFGTEKYSENKIGISVGRRILSDLAIGISYLRNRVSIRNYSDQLAEYIGFSSTFKQGPFYFTYYQVLNKNKLNKPVMYFEAGTSFSKNFNIFLLFKKEKNFPVQKILSILFRINSWSFDAGFGEDPSFYSLGFSFTILKYIISIKQKEDMNLGRSHCFCFYVKI